MGQDSRKTWWASVLGTMGLSVPTAPTTHYHLSSPCVWHSGSGFWMEPCGPRPGSFCLSLPPPLPRLHPGSWSRALSVSPRVAESTSSSQHS